MPSPLLIAGCPRSGTSLSAHAFRACGVWAGPANGNCENRPMTERVLKPLLRAGGMDDIALRSWGDVRADPVKLRITVEELLEEQGFAGGLWMYKDVKLVFCWESWAEAFPDALWVTVWREPAAIVDSFGRWGMGHYIEDPERVVREHHERARMIPEAMEVRPDQLLAGDATAYQAVVERLGLEWRPDEVARVVDPTRFQARGG